MNVLLVSPHRGAAFERIGIRVPPLGLLYIGAVLKKAGHDVEFDLAESREHLPDMADADVVGISCTTIQFKPGLRVAKAAKEQGKIVVMGGPHPTSSADEVLRSGVVDYVVRAEGEETAVELLEGLQHNGHFDPGKVAGLSWLERETGRIVHNPVRPFIQDLDSLPYPLRKNNGVDYLKSETGKIHPTLVTTRGCPYGCKFCDVKLLAGRRFRERSISAVVDEMEYLVKEHGAERVRIVDDIINFDHNRLLALCNEIIRRRLNLVLWVMGRADHLIAHPETAEKMAEAGVTTMFLGIESPHKRVLKAYQKGGKASSDVSAQAVELLRQNGIETFGGFILGEPSETEEEIEETIEYVKSLNPGTAQFSILTPYPGTETWHELEGRLITRDWNLYDGMHAVFRPDHLTPERMEKLCRKAYRSFYLQPKRLAREVFGSGRFGRPNLKVITKIMRAVKDIYGQQPEEELVC
ncbi:MAG: radical SAM protein [Calditrichaeota bacterium]|nr:MAG: radical SAM protein [Calditrichota bacterium]